MLSQKEMSHVRAVEGMENVYSIKEVFREVKFEEDIDSIIPFAKSEADMLMIGGLDDKLSDAERVVFRTLNIILLVGRYFVALDFKM